MFEGTYSWDVSIIFNQRAQMGSPPLKNTCLFGHCLNNDWTPIFFRQSSAYFRYVIISKLHLFVLQTELIQH